MRANEPRPVRFADVDAQKSLASAGRTEKGSEVSLRLTLIAHQISIRSALPAARGTRTVAMKILPASASKTRARGFSSRARALLRFDGFRFRFVFTERETRLTAISFIFRALEPLLSGSLKSCRLTETVDPFSFSLIFFTVARFREK